MELSDYFMQLLNSHSDIKMSEFEDVKKSLIEASNAKHYRILRLSDGKFAGFVTWELQGEQCGISNLLIIKELRGSYNLKRVISFLRIEYPNVRFTWHNRKRNRIFQQRKELCVG